MKQLPEVEAEDREKPFFFYSCCEVRKLEGATALIAADDLNGKSFQRIRPEAI